MKPKHLRFAALLGALLLSPAMLAAHPQQDQGSVADAARKAQAGKKSPAKPATVFTNDNLDAIKGTISVVGQQEAPAANQAAASQDKSKTAPTDDKSKAVPAGGDKPPAQGEEYWRKAFADARKTLANDTKELDVLQREFNLKQTQYYSDPNTAMKEQFSSQDLSDSRKAIGAKAIVVEQDKQAISDLEDKLRQAGGEPGWASAP
jgi:hypothetical protein